MEPGLMTHVQGWLWVFGVVLGLLYVGAPLFTYLNLRQSANPNVIRLDASQQALLPAGVRDYFLRVENELRNCGFEPVDDVALPSQVNNVAANLRLFVHRENQDVASCTAVYCKIRDMWSERLKYISFTSYFRSGAVYGTSNSTVAGCFPPRPHYRSTKFRKVYRVAELYDLHRVVIDDESRASKKDLPLVDQFAGDAAAFIRWTMLAELEDAANSGCLYLSEEAGAYRPTLIGAITMTWKQLWPWQLFLVHACNKRGAEIFDRQRLEGARSFSER
jgi:hypothetical protein